MSKTAQQIFNELEAEKNAQPDLVTLNSNSNTAIWRLWLWLIAFAHKLLYDAWDKTKKEIAIIASQQIIGTAPWYEGLALNWTGGTVTIDVASCKETLTATIRKVILKVATFDTGTQKLINLPSADVDALRAYINSKKVKGTDIDVVSQSADLLWFAFSVKYIGTLAVVKSAVEQKIKDHLTAIPFGNNLSVAVLVNDIFSVTGVLDVTVDFVKLSTGLGYIVQPQNIIVTDAGYFEVGKDIGNNDLINLNMYL